MKEAAIQHWHNPEKISVTIPVGNSSYREIANFPVDTTNLDHLPYAILEALLNALTFCTAYNAWLLSTDLMEGEIRD